MGIIERKAQRAGIKFTANNGRNSILPYHPIIKNIRHNFPFLGNCGVILFFIEAERKNVTLMKAIRTGQQPVFMF